MGLVSTAAKSSSPTGAAGGDLTGTYPDPTVADVSILTTKGDLLARGAAAAARLAVGTDNYVLTADSTQTTGVKWAAAGGGLTTIFDSTLASPAGSIDTGASGIPSGYKLLLWAFVGQSASGQQGINLIFNNDTSGNMDSGVVKGSGTGTLAYSVGVNQGYDTHFLSVKDSFDTSAWGIIPFPDDAVYHTCFGASAYTVTSSDIELYTAMAIHKSAAAITRLALYCNTGSTNFTTGSRWTIWGI